MVGFQITNEEVPTDDLPCYEQEQTTALSCFLSRKKQGKLILLTQRPLRNAVLGLSAKKQRNSFFALVIVHLLTLDEQSAPRLRRYEPFSAVGIVAVFIMGFVRHYVVNEIFRAFIGDLMGFSGSKNECIPSLDVCPAIGVTYFSQPVDYEIEFPLCRVRVIGAGYFSR